MLVVGAAIGSTGLLIAVDDDDADEVAVSVAACSVDGCSSAGSFALASSS